MDKLENLCPHCGEPYVERDGRLKCLTCGYIKPESATKEEQTLLSNAAQKLRLADFEEAKELYSDIIETYPKSAEAEWGILLCEYGIKYESDYDGKKIPSCYSARYESLYGNPHYEKALSLADDKQKAYFQSQAEKIESVRKEWIDKASKEKPYDIFLSFRDTVDGRRTQDSYDAHDLYTHLTTLGYRVFFSRVTLKDKTGENYEPYIFNALNTAKVMLVYASKPEYVTSTWVKNEWTRYLARIREKQKRPDSLCLIIKGFNPSSLPSVLRNRQLLKTEDLTYIKDLESYLDKELREAKIIAPTIERKEIKAKKKEAGKTIEAVETIDVQSISSKKKANLKMEAVERRNIGNYVVPELSTTAENKIVQAKYYLKAKDFARAERLYEEALEEIKENPDALLGLVLCRSSCVDLNQWIETQLEGYDDLSLVIKVINYSKIETVIAILDGYASYIMKLAKERQWGKALDLYRRFGNYDAPSINALPLNLLVDATSHIKEEGCPQFIDALMVYLKTDEKAYQKAIISLGKACLKEEMYDKARIAYDTYAQYYDFDCDTFLCSLQAKKECQSADDFFLALCKENDFSLLSKDIPLSKEELEKLFAVESTFVFDQLAKKSKEIAPFVSFLVRCNFKGRDDFIEKGISNCCSHVSDEIASSFDAFLSSFGEERANEFIDAMMRFAKIAMAQEKTELAKTYLNRINDYDPESEEAYHLQICLRCENYDGDLSKGFAKPLDDYKDIETLLSLRKKRSSFSVIKPYLDALFIGTVDKESTIVFDTLCGYLPKEEDVHIIPYIQKMAEICKDNGNFFDEAEKYYALLVSLKPDDHKAYWGLLQAKLHCKNDEELIEQDTPLAELSEFESAKTLANKDESILSHYIDCELRQLKRLEEKEATARKAAEEEARRKELEEKRKREQMIAQKLLARKRIIRTIVIASASAAAATGIALGILAGTVFIPSSKVSDSIGLIQRGDYQAAIDKLFNQGFGESENLRKMAMAGLMFEGKDYESGIDYVLSAGGSVDVNYDANGGTAEKKSETISPKRAHINNDASKEGLYHCGWSLINYSLSIEGGSYSASLSLKARYITEEEKNQELGIIPKLSSDGKTMTYGMYPQTHVSDESLIASLKASATLKSSGYYAYKGRYYAKKSANPYSSDYTFADGASIVSGAEYWFRCEAIEWDVIASGGGSYTLVSSKLLDAHRYNESYSGLKDGHYANDYANSEIRAWLNADFYGKAFAYGDSYVEVTHVDNSASTTAESWNQFACGDTDDKIYLLSFRDYLNPSYGFSSSDSSDDSRKCLLTDYVIANGAFNHNGNGYGKYWTRSPGSYLSFQACFVGAGGELNGVNADLDHAVRPGLSVRFAE